MTCFNNFFILRSCKWTWYYKDIMNLICSIMNQYVPGLYYENFGTSRDGNRLSRSFQSIRLTKINLEAIRAPEKQTTKHNMTNKNLMQLFNSRNDMCITACMNPCLNGKCLTCSQAGVNDHKILEKLQLSYLEPVNCINKGVYLLINDKELLVEAGSTKTKLCQRIGEKFTSSKDKIHKNREDWFLFGLGTSGDINLDHYSEDIFIMLIHQQNMFVPINKIFNLMDLRQNSVRKTFNKNEIFKFLYSTKASYFLLFHT